MLMPDGLDLTDVSLGKRGGVIGRLGPRRLQHRISDCANTPLRPALTLAAALAAVMKLPRAGSVSIMECFPWSGGGGYQPGKLYY